MDFRAQARQARGWQRLRPSERRGLHFGSVIAKTSIPQSRIVAANFAA